MILRFFRQLFRFLWIALASLILVLIIAYAVLQTKWAKEQVKGKIVSALQESGLKVRVKELEGKPPFNWEVNEGEIDLGEGKTVQFSSAKMRIAILPLLKGKLEIDYLNIDEATYTFSLTAAETQPLSVQELKGLIRDQIVSAVPPCALHLEHVEIARLNLCNRETNTCFKTGLTGKAILSLSPEAFFIQLKIYSLENPKTFVELTAEADAQRNHAEATLSGRLDALPAFLFPTIQGQPAFDISVSGPWSTFHALLFDTQVTTAPIHAEIKAVLASSKFAHYPLLDRTWKIKGLFSFSSTEEMFVQKLLFASDLFSIKGKGLLNQNWEKCDGMIGFSFPDLALLAGTVPFALTGSIDGKAFFDRGTIKGSFETQQLQVGALPFNTVQGIAKGSFNGEEWEGELKSSSTNAQIPFELASAFAIDPGKTVDINDFSLKISEGTLNGYASYAMPTQLIDGALFANVAHMERFAPLLKEENFGGRLALECILSHEDREQNARCVLLANGMRYQEFLLDNVTVSAEISDLYDQPEGKLNVLVEQFYSPQIYISRLNFGTHSEQGQWPFFVDAEGRIENPYDCYAEGVLRKEPKLLTVELTRFSGQLDEIPFSLQYPSEFEWGKNALSLTPFAFDIGDGSLYALFNFNEVRSTAKWELKHFPLEIFSCIRPRFTLNGFVSANGFIDALPESFEGVFNAALEQANILHFGKKEPLRAKGTLQTHLNQNKMQVHTDLRASGGQFLDFAATLPFTYTLYPFSIQLDREQQTSAEIIAEGNLEDLFDFVNLGSNHFTGLVSGRLFLSKTLSSPTLLGNLEWQNGSFNNYFTGITLRQIDAHFEAQNDILRLLSLTAVDDKKGSVSSQGKIDLKPDAFFPYSFHSELEHLHALSFDMIDCDLSGPLYLSGNLHNMTAQGNLLIDEALIQVTQSLPYEIPTLPVTYVNRPSYLYSKARSRGPAFNFHIDLELTSEGNVLVKGAGLNAEVEGNVHLQGTDFNIGATGALKLVKGEYFFSGKVFKLNEGEVVFNDKPTPSAYLNLTGTLSMPDLTVYVTLSGPITSPQLNFHSNPQMPTSSILARILFNKDISEITQPEAIQLASTLMNLSSGAGPDVMEAIRKSIGIDRLNIATHPGTSELAVQIGKYLTRGIMITLSQSATSSQVIVEVELPKGFVFSAETQEQQEGKFSLKWTSSY